MQTPDKRKVKQKYQKSKLNNLADLITAKFIYGKLIIITSKIGLNASS